MIRLLRSAAFVLVALWSLLAWGAYGLVNLFGGLAARNADALSADPATVEWLFWIFDTLRGLGLFVILVVWGLVSLAILAVPWALGRFARPQPWQGGVVWQGGTAWPRGAAPPRAGPHNQIIYPPRPGEPIIEMPREIPLAQGAPPNRVLPPPGTPGESGRR